MKRIQTLDVLLLNSITQITVIKFYYRTQTDHWVSQDNATLINSILFIIYFIDKII